MADLGALLVVDVQKSSIREDTAHILPLIQSLVQNYRPEDVYYLRYRNKPNSFYVRFLNWSKGISEIDTQIIDSVYREGSKIFDHHGYLLPSDLINHLRPYKKVGVCGLDTDACVLGAMFSLWENKIQPVLFEKYCFSCGGESLHQAALSLMKRQFGEGNIYHEIVS